MSGSKRGVRRLDLARDEVSREPPPSVGREPSRETVENHLGAEVIAVEVLSRSPNTSLYRVRTSGGPESVLLKWSHWKTAREVELEFRTLEVLDRAETRHFEVPRPIALCPPWGYLLAEARGRSVARLLTSREAGQDLCRRAGTALRELHDGWAAGMEPIPWSSLLRDLEAMPGGLRPRERTWFEEARETTGESPVQWSRLYLDYNPMNVLVGEDGGLTLIDPPEIDLTGPIWWDLATFCVGLRKSEWKYGFANRCVGGSRSGPWMQGFLEGYDRRTGREDESLLRVFGLQRIGELQVYQSHSVPRSRFVDQRIVRPRIRRWVALALLRWERRGVAATGAEGWSLT